MPRELGRVGAAGVAQLGDEPWHAARFTDGVLVGRAVSSERPEGADDGVCRQRELGGGWRCRRRGDRVVGWRRRCCERSEDWGLLGGARVRIFIVVWVGATRRQHVDDGCDAAALAHDVLILLNERDRDELIVVVIGDELAYPFGLRGE